LNNGRQAFNDGGPGNGGKGPIKRVPQIPCGGGEKCEHGGPLRGVEQKDEHRKNDSGSARWEIRGGNLQGRKLEQHERKAPTKVVLSWGGSQDVEHLQRHSKTFP